MQHARPQGYVSRLDDVTGTFSHAAPELLLGVRRVNEKADCFSYGVVLWEIATQERPLRGQLRDLRCAPPAGCQVWRVRAQVLEIHQCLANGLPNNSITRTASIG